MSHFFDDALEKSKVILYIDKEGKLHEKKSVIVPIACGFLLVMMVVLKAL